jgi:hypothetical protein
MTTDAEIDLAIDKTHLKETKKIHPHVQRRHVDATLERVEKVNKTRPKDKHTHRKKNYYYPIFSNHPYTFQIDLLEQSKDRDKDRYPAFYVIIINVNTKFGYAFPIEDKKQDTIFEVIKDFCTDHRVLSFIGDEEGAFQSNKVLDWLSEHKISMKLITGQRHSALSVVDKFIRTLRDMNTPTVHTQRQSDDPKYRDFTVHRMNKLLNIYNETKHDSHGHTPREMENDIRLEKKFIIRKLYQLERRRKITDFELHQGMFIRYILPKDPNKKHRYKVSPEAYKISHREGNAYVIMAKDGTTKTIARWRIFPLGDTLPPKMKFANTFGNNTGTVNKINSYNKRSRKYNVEFAMPDGTTYNDEIHERNLRGSTPQQKSWLEKQFFAQNNNND